MKVLLRVVAGLVLIVTLGIAYLLITDKTESAAQPNMEIALVSPAPEAAQGATVAAPIQTVLPLPDAAPTATPTAAQREATPTPTASPTPTPTQRPGDASPTPATAVPTAAPAVSEPVKVSDNSLKGLVIGVDPGHQKKANRDTEPVAPGSSTMKGKVSSGTYGRFTGVPEHEVNLAVGLLLKDMLVRAGAQVVMVRETADVNISNVQRAQLFNQHNVDLGVRLHCNGSDDKDVNGAFMLVPKKSEYKAECEAAAKCILEEYGRSTGIGIKKGLTFRSDQTGFNWCERPVVNIEMGHMTNKAEDEKLTDAVFQVKMATGIFNGICRYFDEKQ